MAKTFTQLLDNYKTISRDSSSDNEALGKQLLSDYIREILYMADWTFNRSTATDLTEANKQYYPLPYNCWKLRTATVTVGSTIYTPLEITDERVWSILNTVKSSSNVPTYFYVKPSTSEVGFYPYSSEAGDTITFTFQKKVPDFGETDYTTGTVAVTKGSKAVVGTGTTWTSDMVGRGFKVSKYWYEIASVVDATHLTLVREYGEDTASGASYTIAQLVPLPDGFENIPLYKALWFYFQSREQPAQADQYLALYEQGLSNLLKRDSKTTTAVLKQNATVPINPNDYPEIS